MSRLEIAMPAPQPRKIIPIGVARQPQPLILPEMWAEPQPVYVAVATALGRPHYARFRMR